MLAYAEKTFDLSGEIISRVGTDGYQPRKPVETVTSSMLIAAISQMGSLNALEQTGKWKVWENFIGDDLPSAETFSRTFSHLKLDDLNAGLKHIYRRLKRTKAIKTRRGFKVAIVDGHETSCSEKTRCPGCLVRNITVKGKKVPQYYHRLVTIMLITDDINILLGAEEQLPGEDEVGCATRLLCRVLNNFPRAFEILLCDALYARVGFIQKLLDHKKHIVAVLKKNRNALIQDAEGIFKKQQPKIIDCGKKRCLVYDEENFLIDGLDVGLRVVKSVETTTNKSQLKKKRIARKYLGMAHHNRTAATSHKNIY